MILLTQRHWIGGEWRDTPRYINPHYIVALAEYGETAPGGPRSMVMISSGDTGFWPYAESVQQILDALKTPEPHP